ncbi:MAG: ankyrin repeat domain-containing protein [Chitinispirillaceae bacterium]|nr:ankyrin repeat domain-containing protein [Chitinispirillaceae bacterium]
MTFLQACTKGDLAAVKELMTKEIKINAADASGRTALIEAAWAGHLDVVKFLVDKGAHVNASDNAGFTALMRASESGHAPVISYLISKGASVSCKGNVRGTTPLMLAAEQGHVKVLELLLSKGAKINTVDQFEETALARAYYMNQNKAAQFLESKGGRGKPERSSLSHYSSKSRDDAPNIKVGLPKWSAANDDANAVEEDRAPVDTPDESFEE